MRKLTTGLLTLLAMVTLGGVAGAVTAGLWNTNTYYNSVADVTVNSIDGHAGTAQTWVAGQAVPSDQFPGDTITYPTVYMYQFGDGSDVNGHNSSCLRELQEVGTYDVLDNFSDNFDYLDGTGPPPGYCEFIEIGVPLCAPMFFTLTPYVNCTAQAQTIDIEVDFDEYRNCNKDNESSTGTMLNGDTYIFDRTGCPTLARWNLPGNSSCYGNTTTETEYTELDYIEDQTAGTFYYEMFPNFPTMYPGQNCPPNM